MKGAKAITPLEVEKTLNAFSGKYALRNKALFVLGIKTGLRISEVLSLRIQDIHKDGQILDRIYVQRKNTKGKISGRSIVLNPQAKKAVKTWINQLNASKELDETAYLFSSRKGTNKSISVQQAWNILKEAFDKAGLTGKLSCHTLRKTYAQQIYIKLNRELHLVQAALGHRNINSTIQYLNLNQDRIEEAILSL
ncbi:MAG TPA: tyrosine-type recombinase/integrase [Oligoflexia bacterium]|nr:tyrosine-type recombinase/integrase [Oligoflexia bacterium]HMR24686.1 tyrosine-type recombinase/integrase [Oligoflexia bacterium]